MIKVGDWIRVVNGDSYYITGTGSVGEVLKVEYFNGEVDRIWVDFTYVVRPNTDDTKEYERDADGVLTVRAKDVEVIPEAIGKLY